MKKALIIISIIITNCTFYVYGQIPKESWRDHLAYNKGLHLAITPKKVYYAAYKSGLLSYNLETGEIEKQSKVNGLSDIDINTIQYSEDEEILIIGYSSGNIDLITHDSMINLPDIVNKRMMSSKKINKIICIDNLAYLACDFGIVVLDLSKKEIKDSYLFGPGGNIIKVNDLTILENYLYAATELGLYKADLNSPNLLDYSNWELQTSNPDNTVEYKFISSFANKLYASYNSPVTGHSVIIVFNNNIWSEWNITHDTLINNIDVYNNSLSIVGNENTRFYNLELNEIALYKVPKCKHAIINENGVVYTAGLAYGFYIFENGVGRYLGVINPRFNTTGKVEAFDEYVWIGSGGPFREFAEGGAHIFYDDKWKSLNNGFTSGLEGVGNLYKFAAYPDNPTRVFASGYRFGIYEFNNFEVVNSYTWDNTPLFQETIENYVLVRPMGLDFDNQNNLWTVMDETDQPVYVLRNNNEWEHIELTSQVFTRAGNWSDLEVTSNNQIWMLSRANGIVVIKEEDGSFLETSFALKNQDGDLLSVAYCMTEDNEGNLWIGTNKGPIIYNPSDDIFTDKDVRGYQVKIPRNDGENGADFLLDYEILNEIAVDGGNRKWIATENSGVFLVSDDGKKTIHNFTFENSSLISNNVIGIGVQEKTGEVFMSTNYGIVSYMGTSSEGSDDYSNVYVFPNPVRPDYDGLITIAGLMSNSNVKITDISGGIVYETTSMGGQATWDGKNFYGQRASTGVYLVFLTNEDGSKTHITKLLFVH